MPTFRRPVPTGPAWVQIAKAAVAGQHVGPALFDGAILAVPIALRDHRAPRSFIGLRRLLTEDQSSKNYNRSENYAPLRSFCPCFGLGERQVVIASYRQLVAVLGTVRLCEARGSSGQAGLFHEGDRHGDLPLGKGVHGL